MKKVLVALAMVMGLGSSVAFAYVVSGTQSVEQTQQNPQEVHKSGSKRLASGSYECLG